MSEVAIHCQGLSKQYRLGQPDSYKTIRDVIANAANVPFKKLRHSLHANGSAGAGVRQASVDNQTIWALNDITFEVNRGEVVGVIGRNGAGKSTLLKILSRITKPTKGHAEIHGRVGSLLEVGTGFHPELTGRENIFLNGAILGMRKGEIKRKFDEIVAFAEVEKFIDTPVKRYSSGMYVRLAFAVAAHMETEVLLVDEVLAVGDAQFQKKCFARMREIGDEGRTILFVSHNMSSIRTICKHGVVLEKGKVTEAGEINRVVDAYLIRSSQDDRNPTGVETPSFVVNNIELLPQVSSVIKTFEPLEIRVRFTPKVDIVEPGLYVSILTNEYHRLAGLDFRDFASVPRVPAGQTFEMGFRIDSLPLLPGTYQMEIHLKDLASHKFEFLPQTYEFSVAETPIYGGRKLDLWFGDVGLKAQPIAGRIDDNVGVYEPVALGRF